MKRYFYFDYMGESCATYSLTAQELYETIIQYDPSYNIDDLYLIFNNKIHNKNIFLKDILLYKYMMETDPQRYPDDFKDKINKIFYIFQLFRNKDKYITSFFFE